MKSEKQAMVKLTKGLETFRTLCSESDMHKMYYDAIDCSGEETLAEVYWENLEEDADKVLEPDDIEPEKVGATIQVGIIVNGRIFLCYLEALVFADCALVTEEDYLELF